MKKSFIFFLLLITLVVTITTVNSKASSLKIFEVISGSMEPTIRKGSIVLTTKRQEYKVGDIATYKITGGDIAVTHRIINIFKEHEMYFFTFKGDNNANEDPYSVSEKEIIGKVIGTFPYVGNILYIIFDRKLILYPTAIIGGIFLGKLMRKKLEELRDTKIKNVQN